MSKKQNIKVTVDNIIFTIIKWKLQVLLIQRGIKPFRNYWAAPGWFVHNNESIEEAAYRELEEETSVKNIYLEQLYTFWEVDRDPRGRVVSIAYMSLVNQKNIFLRAWSDAKDTAFFPVNELPDIAFDHKRIINYALKRLKYKLEYTNIAQYLLPEYFTMRQLQDIYEIVFDQKFDVRNFRKKIDKLNIVQDTGKKEKDVSHRPAKLFEFKDKQPKIVEIL